MGVVILSALLGIVLVAVILLALAYLSSKCLSFAEKRELGFGLEFCFMLFPWVCFGVIMAVLKPVIG